MSFAGRERKRASERENREKKARENESLEKILREKNVSNKCKESDSKRGKREKIMGH